MAVGSGGRLLHSDLRRAGRLQLRHYGADGLLVQPRTPPRRAESTEQRLEFHTSDIARTLEHRRRKLVRPSSAASLLSGGSSGGVGGRWQRPSTTSVAARRECRAVGISQSGSALSLIAERLSTIDLTRGVGPLALATSASGSSIHAASSPPRPPGSYALPIGRDRPARPPRDISSTSAPPTYRPAPRVGGALPGATVRVPSSDEGAWQRRVDALLGEEDETLEEVRAGPAPTL